MINMIIVRLEHPSKLLGEVREMAKRHTGYGVKARHYDLVGRALLWTLEKGLGSDWTIDMQDAWKQCYADLCVVVLATLKETEVH